MFLNRTKTALPDADRALPGRPDPLAVPERHAVLGRPMTPPFPDEVETLQLGMGCFWGAERIFWQLPGVWTTAVGYAGGRTPNPTYREVCSGKTGHTEAVLVAYDPAQVALEDVLRVFWEGHDSTQGMRQGNDVGTQYRSALYTTTDAQHRAALASKDAYAAALAAAHRRSITTEIAPAGTFFYAEEYHQQYLHKNPGGYCGIGGTGVACPIGTGVPSATS